MQKHAYLIIAHNNFNLLKTLLKLIDDERNDIYIHIDKKANYNNYEELKASVKKSKIFIYKEYKLYWGDFSLIKVTMFLLKNSIKNKYQYYHLLSGVDLPLKSQDFIHNFFNINQGKNFINFIEKDDIEENIEERIKYYHFFLKCKSFKKGKVLQKLNKILVYLQKILKINRLKKLDYEIYYGCNWFSITHNFALYIIKREKFINKYFKHAFGADELFVQTLIMNSPYKNTLYKKDKRNSYIQCVRKIDWERGNPYVFKKEDYKELIESPYLFARKFDENIDNSIIEMIYKSLKN